MANRLYTERQWRAIQIIERTSEHQRFTPYTDPFKWEKRIYGPAFKDGEYVLRLRVPHWEKPLPPKPHYTVYELLSGLQITRPVQDRSEAIAGARERIRLIGKHWGDYIAKAKQERLEWQTEQEATRAIAKAKSGPAKPKKISKRAKAVFDASNGKCHYCGIALTLDGKWHIEHKMPRALFGGSEQSNLAASCVKCNHRKRDKTDIEFHAILAQEAA
jgi:5-methylcytosine-specific restriction endonuclease McrA